MSWQSEVQAVVQRAESILPFIQKALLALNESPDIKALVASLPVLLPWEAKLLDLIPVVGEVSTALQLIDFTLEHWQALTALGAAMHFAPADSLTYRPWKDSSDPGDRQD